MQGEKSLPWGEKSTGEKVTQPKVDTFTAPTTPIVVVIRVGDAWLAGVGKRAPHGFRCPCLVSPHGSLNRLKSLYIISSTLNSKKTHKTGLGTIGQGRAGKAGSEMWGVLLVPSSSPTVWPMYDGVDVNVISNVTWFYLDHDMVSRRIYKLSFYGRHSITWCCGWCVGVHTSRNFGGRYMIYRLKNKSPKNKTRARVQVQFARIRRVFHDLSF